MNYLTPAEWAELDRIAARIHELSTPEEFEGFILTDLPEFLGCRFASWNEHTPEFYLGRVVNSPPLEEQVAPLVPALNATLHSHPLFPRYVDFSTQKVRMVDTVERLLDHTSKADWHNTPFYQQVGSKLGVEDQLIMHLAVNNGGHGVLITLHLSEPCSPEAHLKAAILRGHLVARLNVIYKQSLLTGRTGEMLEELRATLTEREFDVLSALCQGKKNSEIGEELDIAKRTVDKHVQNILSKLGEENRTRIIARYAHLLRLS